MGLLKLQQQSLQYDVIEDILLFILNMKQSEGYGCHQDKQISFLSKISYFAFTLRAQKISHLRVEYQETLSDAKYVRKCYGGGGMENGWKQIHMNTNETRFVSCEDCPDYLIRLHTICQIFSDSSSKESLLFLFP